MQKFIAVLTLSFFGLISSVQAAATCEAQAGEKKLAGAAKN